MRTAEQCCVESSRLAWRSGGRAGPEDAWISFIIRDGRLAPAHADTMLQPNDEVVVLADHNDGASLRELFGS